MAEQQEMEVPKFNLLRTIVSLVNAAIVAMIDFGMYLVVASYMTGLAALVLMPLLAFALRKYRLTMPTFLEVWAALMALRLIFRSTRIEG